jgi:hypothetical protein
MLQLIKRNSYIAFMLSVNVILSIVLTIKLGDPVEYITVVVENGDSLWGYATEYGEIHNMPSENFVSWVMTENNLSSAKISPGESLTLPIEISAIADK